MIPASPSACAPSQRQGKVTSTGLRPSRNGQLMAISFLAGALLKRRMVVPARFIVLLIVSRDTCLLHDEEIADSDPQCDFRFGRCGA